MASYLRETGRLPGGTVTPLSAPSIKLRGKMAAYPNLWGETVHLKVTYVPLPNLASPGEGAFAQL